MESYERSRLDSVFGGLVFVVMIVAAYMALVGAPRESEMKDIQRIFYFHVPAGIAGLLAFAVNFAGSIGYLVRKDRRWDGLAVSAAEVGVVLLALVLVTGPIWAKPVWGVWWTWSPRLTSSLVLWLLYVAYLLVRNYVSDPDLRATTSSVFGIVAFIDAPIVWFSIRWWRDLHPSPMLETGGLAKEMRPALWSCVVALLLLMIYLIQRRYQLEVGRQRLEAAERQADLSGR